ncbi:MAG TPA: hypothetical protein VLS89_05405, partial [Candidatus Nanopelagicales bacterium]|nr:hypothetical protein [Candidatus Nanopelagicales bacterium]
MWILPLPLPADARVRLPPGRHRFPWYHTTAETERLAQLLAGLLEGVDRHLIVPWSTARSLADARTQPALATTLLVVTADDPELDDDRIDEIIRRIACPHAMVKLPRPGSLGYAWQERHIKPALISLLHEHLGAPEHPLASLHIDALPVKLAASLTTDVLELIELLEATAADRMAHAAEGISPGDYERSLLEQAGRALAARLLRLRMDQVPGALGIVLAGGRGTPDDEDFRQGAEALEAVGLARYMGGGLSLGPLARRANEPVLRTALLRTIPEALHAPPAPAPPSSRRAREALASEPQPAAAPSAISPGRYDDLDGLADLLAEVQTITRLRHGEATIEVVPAPPPVRFHLRVTERAGDISDVRVVAAVEGEVTDDYLQSFLRDVVASYRSTDPGLIATLVYSGRRPSEALVRRAAMQRVHLVSFTEYQEIIDLRGYVE